MQAERASRQCAHTTTPKMPQDKRTAAVARPPGSSQASSFILFAGLVLLVNLCPFQSDFEATYRPARDQHSLSQQLAPSALQARFGPANYLLASLEFVKLMFTQPLRLNKRVTHSTLAEARVIGKMAKVWYIKKKIKKLSKKLKKHTIAVPVFTAIPIYEHSYYPQPHVTHVSHAPVHHAAASSYSPAVAHMAASSTIPMATSGSSSQQQLATSASNQHHMAYRVSAPHHRAHHGGGAMYHPSAAAHHIINAYAPSPPLFVDDTGGLYGTYNNAYGRYDGGYHVW